MDAVVTHQLHVCTGVDSTFSHHHTVTRHLLSQSQRSIQAGLEGMQITVVDADELCVQRYRPLQFLFRVHFH